MLHTISIQGHENIADKKIKKQVSNQSLSRFGGMHKIKKTIKG